MAATKPPRSTQRGTDAHRSPVATSRPGAAAPVLNMFPIALNTSSVTVWAGRWIDGLDDDLRARHSGLTTWRDTDDGNRLYVWNPTTMLPETSAGVPAGFQEVTVTLEESPQLFERLITDAVEKRLAEIGFAPKGGGWVNYGKGSLLAAAPALASALARGQRPNIGIYPKIIVEVFFTRDASERLSLGLVVDVLYTTRMDVTAAEWVAAGLTNEVRGKYVLLLEQAPEAQRHPTCAGRVVGRIDAVRDDRCVLSDRREPTLVELPLTSVAPEPTRANLACYLAARYEEAYQKGEKPLAAKLRELVRPAKRQELADALVMRRIEQDDGPYASDGLSIMPGVTARFSAMAPTDADTFPVRRLTDPEYSFDRAGKKYARRVDVGLKDYGPYDQQVKRQSRLRLLVVALEENKGDVRVALQRLLGGVQTDKHVFTGLKAMYRLENLEVSYAFAPMQAGAPMKRYSEALTRALQEAPTPPPGEPRFHLVLTVTHDAFHALPDSENPYYQTKVLALITEGVPTQAITVEKLRQREADLQYILNTMSVAMYAKLGGVSHVLKLPVDDASAPTELIFGIGRSMRRVGRFGEAEETIGFATVFRANGEYLYNDCTPYCDKASYEGALEDTIRRSVEKVAAFEALPDGAPLRLIFHVPRRPGGHEKRPILNAVRKLPRFKVEFALIHVNDDHRLQVFDLGNTNPRTGAGRPRPEALLLPPRGLAVRLGPRERLVTFIGVDQYRGNGSPSPLRITLDKESTFKDLDYLTQQLFWLSFMNAGTLNPGVAPVTITYAERVAYLTGRLRAVQSWTVELIKQKLGRALWFV
jgi:hypothetical protein